MHPALLRSASSCDWPIRFGPAFSSAARSEGAGIPAGRGPGASCLDPSGELLLVANRDSNDLAVIGVRTGNLLTLVPVGSQPSDVAALLF